MVMVRVTVVALVRVIALIDGKMILNPKNTESMRSRVSEGDGFNRMSAKKFSNDSCQRAHMANSDETAEP